jgi:hypothetical protein
MSLIREHPDNPFNQNLLQLEGCNASPWGKRAMGYPDPLFVDCTQKVPTSPITIPFCAKACISKVSQDDLLDELFKNASILRDIV